MKKFSFLVLPQMLMAVSFSGIGFGDSPIESKRYAISDLSNQLSVSVKSELVSSLKLDGKDNVDKKVEETIVLSSDLPLKGTTINVVRGKTLKTVVRIDSKHSLKVYEEELKHLKKEIDKKRELLQSTKNKTLQYSLLEELLQDLQSFHKHALVAKLLGAKKLPQVAITTSEVKYKLQQLQQNANSLEMVAKLLTKGIDQKRIYISAIKPKGSKEVTQFAKILKELMQKDLDSVKQPSHANYIFKGSYEILKDKIFVYVELLDSKNNIVETNSLTFDKNILKGIEYKPVTKSFDAALNSSFVQSGKLRVQVGFRGYFRDDGIELVKGDTVDIVAKTNKPMCYFLVGHVLHKDQKFSYLIPIGSDNTPYINYITGDDVNKMVTIAEEVPIEAPFGNETLQIFAATLTKNGKCTLNVPQCSENDEGYCVLGENPQKVVQKTRALALHKKKKKVQKAEASLRWTSFAQ